MKTEKEKHTKTKNVHQLDIALIQLERACELFFRKDLISAMTLAGAADEILEGLANTASKMLLGRKKKERGVTALTIEAGIMSDFFGEDFGTYKQKRNLLRNNFKHLKENYAVDISDLELKVKQFIDNGITNYKLINGQVPDLQMIKQFCKEVGVN